MQVLEAAIPYGLHHPIIPIDGSPWIVVGSTAHPGGMASSFDIHFNGDDPTHEFLDPSEWSPLPNAKKLAATYNRPFEKAFRLRIRRATDAGSILQVMAPHWEAADLLWLARQIQAAPGDDHHMRDGVYSYYPDGHTVRGPQVWKNGTFWLRCS
ncbi:MAG: hypothetical protein ABFD92_10785 [Planctomycetaceae bacterium]